MISIYMADSFMIKRMCMITWYWFRYKRFLYFKPEKQQNNNNSRNNKYSIILLQYENLHQTT